MSSSSEPTPWISRTSGVLISVITTIVFNRASKFLEVTRATQPSSTKNNEYLSWKWRNFLISLIHSAITGLSTLYCFYDEPLLYKDMLNAPSKPAYLLACFSNGYFLYDLIEMILKFGYKGAGELIGHHLLVISCLSISVWQHRYLHFRQLLNIAKVSKRSILYRLNCWTNIASFLLFRMFTLVWLGKCLYEHQPLVPLIPFATALICLMVVSVMTCVLLYRLIYSDFIAVKQTSLTDTPLLSESRDNYNIDNKNSSCFNSSSSFNNSNNTNNFNNSNNSSLSSSNSAAITSNNTHSNGHSLTGSNHHHNSSSSSNHHSSVNSFTSKSACDLMYDKLPSSFKENMNKFK